MCRKRNLFGRCLDSEKISLGANKFSFAGKFNILPQGSKDEPTKNKGKGKGGKFNVNQAISDGAEIIGYFSPLWGGNQPSNGEYPQTAPPPSQKTNWPLIGGVAAAITLLIILLILSKNGKTSNSGSGAAAQG